MRDSSFLRLGFLLAVPALLSLEIFQVCVPLYFIKDITNLVQIQKTLQINSNIFVMNPKEVRQEVSDRLIQCGLFDSQDKITFLQATTGMSDIQEILKHLFDQSGLSCAKSFIELKDIRKHFQPFIHIKFLALIIAGLMDLERNPDAIQSIEEILGRPLNKKDWLLNIINCIDQSSATQDDFQFFEEKLSIYGYLFEELESMNNRSNELDSITNNMEEEEIPDYNEEREPHFEKDEDYKQEIKRVQEDIKRNNMPNTIVDYKIRKAEIDIGNLYLSEEPILLPEIHREMVENLPENNNKEVKKAKQQILKGNNLIRNLKVLKFQLCGFDIYDVFRNVQKGDQENLATVKKAQEDGKGMKVILFFGLSKAGKTTMITRALGYKMEEKMVNGMKTVQPIDLKKEHKQLVIGNSSRSTTRYPRMYKVPKQCLPGCDQDNNIYCMDVAGLQDTAGLQVECANRIILGKCMRNIKNLQIVIVISEKNWGDNGKGICKLAQSTSSFIKDLKSVQKSIKIVYNNCSKGFLSELPSKIKDLERTNETQNITHVHDQNYNYFFKILKEQSSPEKMNAIKDIFTFQFRILFASILKQKFTQGINFFTGDIGPKCTTAIEQQYERCNKEFQKRYQQEQIPEAIFYFKYITDISKMPGFQTKQNELKAQISKKFGRKIINKMRSLKNKLQELKSMTGRNIQQRINRIVQFHKDYQELQGEARQYLQLQINQDQFRGLVNDLQYLVPDYIQYIQEKVRQWDNFIEGESIELVDQTKNGICFLEVFDEKASTFIKSQLEKKEKRQTQNLNRYIDLEQYDDVSRQRSNLTALQCAQNKQKDFRGLEIKKKFLELKEKINSLNLDLEDLDGIMVRVPQDYNQGQQIAIIERMIYFLKIFKSYPEQQLSESKQYQKIYKHIMVTIPQKAKQQFYKLMDATDESVDEDEEGRETTNNSINNITQFIKSINFLLQVRQIRQRYENGLVRYDRLYSIIDRIRVSFSRLIETFNNNEMKSGETKKKIKKLLRKFEKMVKIVRSQDLENKFQQIKQQLDESILNYINSNCLDSLLSLNDTNVSQELALLKYQKLKNLKGIDEVMQSQRLKEAMKAALGRISQGLIKPIVQLLYKINKQEAFFLQRLKSYHSYVSRLRSEPDLIEKILNLEGQIKCIVQKLYNGKIKGPLQDLGQKLSEKINLEEGDIVQLASYLREKGSINRKACKMMNEIKEFETLSYLFNENDENLKQLDCKFDDFKEKVEQEIRKLDSSIFLDRLGEIVSKLNYISKDKTFTATLNQIENKLREIATRETNMIQSFITTSNSPSNFNAIEYKTRYEQTRSQQDKVILKNHLNKYLSEVCEELSGLESEENSNLVESGRKKQMYFEKYNKYRRNMTIIDQIGPARSPQSDAIDLKTASMYRKLRAYRNQLEKSYPYLNEHQINQISIIVRDIDISRIHQNQVLNNDNPVMPFDEVLRRMKDKKEQILQGWRNQDMIDQLNDTFLRIMESLNRQKREQIEVKASNDLKNKINLLPTIKQRSQKQFSETKMILNKKIRYLDGKIQDQLSNLIINVIQKIQNQRSSELHQLKTSDLQSNFPKFLRLIDKFERCGDSVSVQQIIAIIREKYPKKTEDRIDFFKGCIWVIRGLGQSKINNLFGHLESELFDVFEATTNEQIGIIQNQSENEFFSSDNHSNDSEGGLSLRRKSIRKLIKSSETLFQIKQMQETRQLLQPINKQKVDRLIAKIDKFFNDYFRTAETIINRFNDCIGRQFIGDTTSSIISLFQEIQKLKQDYVYIKTKKPSKYKNKAEEQQIILSSSKEQLFKMVKQKNTYSFNGSQVRQNSLQQVKQGVKDYNQGQEMLYKIQAPYNLYLSPPEPINMQANKAEKDKNELNMYEEYKSSLAGDMKGKNMDHILRILQLFKSKYYEKCLEITEKTLEGRAVDVKNKIVSLYSKWKNIEQIYNKAKDDQEDKCNYEKEKISKRKTELKKDYKQKKDRVQNDDEKQEIEDKQQVDLHQLQNQMSRQEEQLRKNMNTITSEYCAKKFQLVGDVIVALIEARKLGNIAKFKERVRQKINQELKAVNRKHPTYRYLYEQLKKQEDLLATRILEEHEIFSKIYNAELFKKQTQATDKLQYIIGQMRSMRIITQDQAKQLRKYFQVFENEQTLNIDENDRNKLKNSILNEAFELRKQNERGVSIGPEKKVKLLAKIFALWSVITGEEGGEHEDGLNPFKVQRKAHAAQILCVLLILCFDNPNIHKNLITENRLAEVKTGQGKSIVLAMISVYLALFGYQVHCACYSKILSRRDLESFLPLFKQCKVQNQIYYGTFEEIIKTLLNQESDFSQGKKFQDQIKQVLTEERPQSNIVSKFFGTIKDFLVSSNKEKTKKVLLIDEIDILFHKDYFGETFNQSIALRDPTITKLFKFIWGLKKSNNRIDYEMIIQSIQFKSVIQKFQPLEQILKNQVYGMMAALQTYNDPQIKYYVTDKRIKYKVQDSLMEVSYRYNTVYAYLQEDEKAPAGISRDAFNQNMAITLCVAQFAYHVLPEYYSGLLGVTGTLTELPTYIRQHLQGSYKINAKKMFQIPSIYQKSIRIIQEPKYVPKKEYFAEIVKNISQKFNSKRPVLTFFDSRKKLNQFYLSQEFDNLREYTTILHEEDSYEEREIKIKACENNDTITLMTNSFIRGTDFQLSNKKVIEAGGYHAIVAYLIDSPADYIQATGRVARQGKEGSFIEIYPKEEFESRGIRNQGLSTARLSELVKDYRINEQQNSKNKILEKLDKSKEDHKQTLQIFGKELSKQKLINYIETNYKNKFPKIFSGSKSARFLILVDATYSMSVLFEKLKIILQIVFDDIYQTLAKKNFPGCLQLQLVLYRNYNSDTNQILQASAFDNQGQILKTFLNNRGVNGGWGNQAIEVALQHANLQQNIHGIFIIGDARGNTERQIQQKRSNNLEQKRLEAGMTRTTTQKQLEKLREKNIKINSFYLYNTRQIRKYFQKLSQQTSGQSQYLDIDEAGASQTITTSIVEEVLRIIGGDQNGQMLIAAYQQLLKIRMGK